MGLYERVILPSLHKLGYKPEDIRDFEDRGYIATFSPLTVDENTRSCMIFKENGNLKLFNGTVATDDDSRTVATLTEWLRKTDAGMEYYIKNAFFELDEEIYEIFGYREYVKNKILSIPQRYNPKYEKLRKALYKKYIIDLDILDTPDSILEVSKFEKMDKPKKEGTTMIIEECSMSELSAVARYLVSRGINKTHPGMLARTIVYNDMYRKPSICFAYEGGFYKYRMIFEKNKQYRFMSKGSYSDFFHCRVTGDSDTLYVVEGELEGLSILPYTEHDVISMHNTNSLPSNTSIFKNYKKVVFKIDKDRYAENADALGQGFEAVVDFKVDHPTKDYNDLLVEGVLTNQIVETINIEEV